MKLITNNNNKTLQETAQLLIENAEGFSSTWYQDSMGNDTIGYGFKAGGMAQKYNLDLYKSRPMTELEGILILENIISEIGIALRMKLPFFINLPINQAAVLIDMAYNLGLRQFYAFAIFLSYIEKGQIDNAVADLTDTLWYQQVKNRAVRDCFNLYAQPTNLYLM